MFCPHCGNEIPNESRYCLACGKSPAAAIRIAKPIGRRELVEAEESKNRSHAARNVLIGFVLLFALYMLISKGGTSSMGIGRRDALISGSVIVKAGTIYFVKFTVDGSARVVGRFETTGGPGNDIQAVIASSDEFENWQNGHQARVLFQTEKTTVATVDVPINQPGTYYLAFNNKFSVQSDKTVTGNIVLHH